MRHLREVARRSFGGRRGNRRLDEQSLPLLQPEVQHPPVRAIARRTREARRRNERPVENRLEPHISVQPAFLAHPPRKRPRIGTGGSLGIDHSAVYLHLADVVPLGIDQKLEAAFACRETVERHPLRSRDFRADAGIGIGDGIVARHRLFAARQLRCAKHERMFAVLRRLRRTGILSGEWLQKEIREIRTTRARQMSLRKTADRSVIAAIAAAVPPVRISAVGAGLDKPCRMPCRRRRVPDAVGSDEHVDLIHRRCRCNRRDDRGQCNRKIHLHPGISSVIPRAERS